MPLQKRRLTDLWVVGRELVVDDDSGEEPVTVWLQKLNPIEQAEASRKADAARARFLVFRNQPDSDQYQQERNAVLSYGDEPRKLADFLLGEERMKAQIACSSQVFSKERWSKDNYLQGLFDAWAETLRDRWLKDQTDEEANRVMAELTAYNTEVNEAVDDALAVQMDMLLEEPIEDLRRKMFDRLFEVDAGQVWMDEYQRHMIFLGTRDPENRKVRYFEDRAEVDELYGQTLQTLKSAFEAMEVNVIEGKSSPAPPSSSTSSEAQNSQGTDPVSGPEAVSV